MSYVDLNPLRADLCQPLEDVEHTSIKQRIDQFKQQPVQTPVNLAEFIGSQLQETGIAFSLRDYLELTDWTGRCIYPKKRSYIPESPPKILQQLDLETEIWLETVTSFKAKFHTFIGSEQQLKATCTLHHKQWTKGLSICRRLFRSTIPIPV